MLSHLSKSNEVEKNFTKERINNNNKLDNTGIINNASMPTSITTTTASATNIQNYNANVNVVPESFWNHRTGNNEQRQIGSTASKATNYCNDNNQRSKVC